MGYGVILLMRPTVSEPVQRPGGELRQDTRLLMHYVNGALRIGKMSVPGAAGFQAEWFGGVK